MLVLTILNNFKIELEKLAIFNKTRNNLIENIIKNEFDTHTENLKKILGENLFLNSKPNKTIEYLNNKMEELYGYKAKSETYKSQVDLLLNEQRLLKDQIKVYRKISDESKKINEMQKEKIDKYKLDDNIYKDILRRAKKYVQRHFSKETQTELLKILDRN